MNNTNPEFSTPSASTSVSPLVAQLTDAIKVQYIDNTKLSALPSERQLAVEQQVSRKSIRKALKQIEDLGLVRRHEGGKIRYIVRNEVADDWSSIFPSHIPNAFSSQAVQPKNSISILANDMSLNCRVERLHELWEQLVSEIENTNDRVPVELLHWPVVGSIPDAPLHGFDLLQASAHNDLLYDPHGNWYPLEDWLQKENGGCMKEIWAPLWADAERHGRVLGVPFQAVAPCLVANRELWQQAWQGAPFKTWSWESCLDIAERVTDDGRTPAFTVTNVSVLLNSVGFDVYSPEQTSPTSEMAETLTRLCRMVTIHDVRYILEPVAVGRVPFSTIMSCSIATLEQQHPGRFVYLPHPSTSSGWFYRYVSLLYLNGQSCFPAQCLRMMKFLTSAPVQSKFAAIGNAIPANHQAWTKFSERQAGCGNLSFLVDTVKRSRPLPLNDRQMLEIETAVLGPEFLVWYQNRRVTEENLKWLRKRLITYCEQRAGLESSLSRK